MCQQNITGLKMIGIEIILIDQNKSWYFYASGPKNATMMYTSPHDADYDTEIVPEQLILI